LFNSIGCWAEAIDYNSIGEKMVMTPGKGMLAFVGNSRFGWGSPLAPGFGYSEFYQKEFFRLLFKQQVNHIAATNALQKIPFVPYFYGTSVYKWCAYELNEEGDSYFRLFTDNPKPMTCNAKFYESMNMFEVNVTSEGQPVPNAILYFAEEDTVFITDNSGRVNIQCSGINNFPFEAFSIYAENCMNIDSPSLSEIASIAHHPFLNGLHFERVSEDKLCQGISYHGAISLLNNFAQSISGFVDIITDPSMVEISNTHIPFQVDGGDWKTIRFNAWVKSIDQIGQLPDGTPIQFEVRVISDSLADDVSEKYYYQVITPVITLESLNFDAESISPGEYFPFTMTFSLPQSYMNYSYNFTHLDVTLSSDVVTFAQNVQSTCFRNEYNGPTNSYAKIGNYISIPSDAVEGQILPFHAKAYLIWNFLFYTFDFDLAISVGRLKYFNDFEHVLDLTGDSAWQRVPATYILGVSNYALSCRPSVYGTYNISTPNFVYQDSTRVSFRYKYKMPMYGKDGVFVKLIRGNDAENLIFLGSGGALGRVNNDDYISSDPATYQLDLASLSQLNLQPGDLFHIEFSFVYADTSGFNDYTNMPDVGVFIDDLEISNRSQMDLNVSIATPEIRINSYPNPIGQFDLLKIDILNWDYTPNPSIIVIHKDPQYSVEIYNIRGQRVYKNRGVTTANIPKKLVWDLKGVDGKKVGSGVYILRVKSGEKVVTKKITIVK
ncbi:MAG TPA: T9SS type A sorting domain-containing protein, partial [Candidatus Cloacimonadota bacterium]|nr:T9SS type A sorting domain-containing protein [Candidatus Cloacimonadota bacterium]